jgi:hypothetical protein
MPTGRGAFFSSPVLVGDKLYCIRNNGDVIVGAVSDKGFKVLAQNKMNEHMVATPVFVDGRLYLRGDKHLYCFGK